MKKLSFVLFFLLLAGVFASAEEQRPIDLVVVLDTSSSMYASYREVSEYVVGPMLKEFLRIGDTFHLIGFSGAPRAEVSRRIEGVGDVETIVSRMLLMYPLDPHSDVVAALEYVSRYLSDLPDTRPKTIVFISDGEHLPPSTSTYANLSPETVKSRLMETTSRLKGNGWTFHFLRVPFKGEGKLIPLSGTESPKKQNDERGAQGGVQSESSGKEIEAKNDASNEAKTTEEEIKGIDVSDTVADLLTAPVVDWSAEDSEASIGAIVGAIAVEFPKDLGKSDRSVTVPLVVRNPSLKPVYLETQAVLIEGVDRMAKRSFRELGPRSHGTLKIRVNLPADFPLGRTVLQVEPLFTGSVRISPQSGSVAVEIVQARFSQFFSAALPAILFSFGLLAACLIALLVIVLSRRVSSAPSRVVSGAAAVYRSEREKSQSAAPSGAQEQKATKAAGASAQVSVPSNTYATKGAAGAVGQGGSSALTEPIRKSSDDTAALLAGFASRTAADEASRGSLLANSSSSSEPSAAVVKTELPTAAIMTVPGTGTRERRKEAALFVPYEVRKADARTMLSLFVEDQNTMIGKRNVHLLKAGSSLSLGGGNSDFLVFLVPIPRRIADIRFDGEKCILVPRKPEFFPDTGAEPIEDCVGKTIRLVSQKGYELRIRLDRFEDPLVSLNRFLHSIDLPGR